MVLLPMSFAHLMVFFAYAEYGRIEAETTITTYMAVGLWWSLMTVFGTRRPPMDMLCRSALCLLDGDGGKGSGCVECARQTVAI